MIEITPQYLASQGLSPDFPNRFWEKVRKTDSCWIWKASVDSHGYGHLWKTGKRLILAHRASWIIHRGPIPIGKCVLHNCPNGDNRACVNPDHLWIGTIAENNVDCALKGRNTAGQPPGERHAMHKLTEQQVRQIRSEYERGGTSYSKLSALFAVKASTIGMIVRRTNWTHI